MNELEAIKNRHSVRNYIDKPISDEHIKLLQDKINEINIKSNLNIQLKINEPKAFESKLFHYGMFKNVKNYFVLIGKDDEYIDEKCGYYGEELVLYSQMIGLNTCWVALTYDKRKLNVDLKDDEKVCIVIALGYGVTQGKPHKSKTYEQVCKVKDAPSWFIQGVESALLAPTAVNQQNFIISLENDKVQIKPKNKFCSKVDIGIIKYHFEVGANKRIFNNMTCK